MTHRMAVLALALACSTIAAPRPALAQRALTQSDSAAIVRAVWKVLTEEVRGGYRVPALWLWTPTADTARFVRFSPALRVALVMDGILASTRRPIGDDTLVVRIARWRADSTGVTMEVQSFQTTVLGSGAHRCRASSGAVEHFRAHPRGTDWIATRFGSALAGDGACVDIK